VASGRNRNLPVLLLFNIDFAWEPHERERAFEENEVLGRGLIEEGHPVALLPVLDSDLAGLLRSYRPEDYIVFNLCEAIPGVPQSEALAAALLESLGFVYTGSPPGVLALSEDKSRVKELLASRGIPTPAWRLCRTEAESDTWSDFPAIVKAADRHCSEAVTPETVVTSPEELRRRLSFMLETYGQPALVEHFIDGREFHVSLWGNGRITMLPPAEMDFSAFSDVRDRLCTYEAKFVPESKHYQAIRTLLPAPLSEREYRTLRRVAVSTYKAMGCRDYARLDIRLHEGVFYVLDVNPNADISSDASMACAAEFKGYSYGRMGSILVRMAAKRHPVFCKWA
jgi:D-alanine-D-alanine ligase